MPGDYALLASVYDTLGMSTFAETMTARLIDFAQRNDWMGRHILEMGCGTGATLEWLTRHNYIVRGIDNSPEMLSVCRQRLEAVNLHHELHEQDIRDPNFDFGTADLVLALDVINEHNSLRDLEAMFRNAHKSLTTGRFFIFDMHTIQGLTTSGQSGDHLAHNSSNLAVIVTRRYDFDRQVQEENFLIFHQQDAGGQRHEGTRVLRGYPAQAIATLLQRCGLTVKRVVTPTFEDFEPGLSQADRIIFVTEKQ